MGGVLHNGNGSRDLHTLKVTPMPNNKQIVRQLDILREFSTRKYGVTIRELAEGQGVSTRTIHRDLNDLQEAGFFLDAEVREGQKYWKFDQNTDLLSLKFPIDEIIALKFIEGIVSSLAGTPFNEAFNKTLNRIRTTLPEDMRAFLARAGTAYYPHQRGQKAQIPPEIFATAHRAIKERKICNVTYRAITTGQTKTYPITPFRLLYYHNGFYLLCRNPNYGDLLTLAAERIQALEITAQPFGYPYDLDIEGRVQQAFGIVLEDPIPIKVRFSASQAPYVKQRIWHPSQEIEELDTGEIILSFRAGGLHEIKSWILSHGAEAEVLEPPGLREEITAELKKNLHFYQKT